MSRALRSSVRENKSRERGRGGKEEKRRERKAVVRLLDELKTVCGRHGFEIKVKLLFRHIF